MVVILKHNTTREETEHIIRWMQDVGNIQVNPIFGEHTTILGLVGDTSAIDINRVESNPHVESVKRIQEPYKRANRKFHPENSVIDVAGCKFGGEDLQIIAGPCSVETEEQIIEVAKAVKAAGATLLRGGAFKPRTSPYSFQGLGCDGIDLLLKAKEATGLPLVTEIMNINHLPYFENVDLIQVGARNMQNFEMLKELGKINKPILLKRGLANTIEEFLMSAEYIMAGGNDKVILCERGIRTFEPATRNTLDISAVPLLKRKTHLPVIVDPSHAAGITWMVEPLSKAAVAAGTDGLMIEVHNNPSKALSDGAQSLKPSEFAAIMEKIRKLAVFEGRHIG